jgi:DNA-binding MarR family transcriptional regulator
MGWCTSGDPLDQDLFDAMSEFLSMLIQRGERLAGRFGVPFFAVKAMHRFDASVTMKELGQRMKCDPSFVTMIADTLEQHGLARREPSASDRRIKNLVLTDKGLEVKRTIEETLLTEMPWVHVLDRQEREQFLALIRKMTAAMKEVSCPRAGSADQGEVTDTTSTASPAHA